MLTHENFTQQVMKVADIYKHDNQWVVKHVADWTKEHIMANLISCAYNLYAATATNRLMLTVLGGTEIRSDSEYIRNFGVTAANGIQDAKTLNCMMRFRMEWSRSPKYLEINRKLAQSAGTGNAKGATGALTYKEAKRHANAQGVSLGETFAPLKAGSILSEKGWSPILNDSLIIGAATANQGFTLALTAKERAAWKDMNEDKVDEDHAEREYYLASTHGGSKKLINAWKAFFNSQKIMFFYDDGTPRVFVRELLGLSFFGYKPEFRWQQLGFSALDKSKRPSFNTYLEGLRGVKFRDKDQIEIMKAISLFLFGDKKAIGSPWSANTRTQ